MKTEWRSLQKIADSLDRTGRLTADAAVELHDARQATAGNCYAATADVLKVLAWAATHAADRRSDAALHELADLVNEWAAGQRVTLSPLRN
jgi:hypothetical protein